MKKYKALLQIIMVSASVLACQALACPKCKEATADANLESGNMTDGFSWSIILMLGVVCSMIAFGVFQVYKIVRAEESRLRHQIAR